MALRRFFIEASEVTHSPIRISGDLFHHIGEVCRFSVGDQFELLPGDGTARLVTVQKLGKKELEVIEQSSRALPELPLPRIHLALSVPKFPKVDWIVEKAVELGVYKIHPYVSDFSFVRSAKDLSPSKIERWLKLIRAATQQSGRGDLMSFEPLTDLSSLLKTFNQSPQTAGLFPYEGRSQAGLREAILKLKSQSFTDLWVFVGSEGGFSEKEVQLFSTHGLPPISMGEQILRVETACVTLVSVLKYEFGALT